MDLEKLRAEDIARILLRLAFIILGVYLVVQAVITFFGLLADYNLPVLAGGSSPRWHAALLYGVPILVIGVLLVALSGWLARRLYPSARPAVSPPQPEMSAACPSCGLTYNPTNYDPGAPDWLCARCGARLGP